MASKALEDHPVIWWLLSMLEAELRDERWGPDRFQLGHETLQDSYILNTTLLSACLLTIGGFMGVRVRLRR